MTTRTQFEPIRICEIELGERLTGIPSTEVGGRRQYRFASVLVRLHGEPIGVMRLSLDGGGLSAKATAAAIDAELGAQIRSHLRADGLEPPRFLTEAGLLSPDVAACAADLHGGPEPDWATVVITTRNRTPQLESALVSVLAMRYPRFDVVVVDNRPSDGTTEAMVRTRFGEHDAVTYVREDWPGIAAARNTGVRRARGAIIAFTDDDVEVDPDWLSQLVAGFTAAESVGVVTGLTLAAAIDLPVHAMFEEFGGFARGFEQRVIGLGPDRPAHDPLFPYAAGRLGTGNNMAFRADVLQAIGGFDPCLGVGSPTRSGEDLAAFIRALWGGWKLAYRPSALVYHHHRDTYDALRRQVYGYGVGLSAGIVSCLARRPGMMTDFLVRVPQGIWHLISPRSARNRRRTRVFPLELAVAEALGLAYGPFAYARARFGIRRRRAARTAQ